MLLNSYWNASREPRYSLTFAFPLLLLYEGLSLFLSQSAVAGVRNGADVLLKVMFLAFGGRNGLIVFGAVLFGAGGWLILRDLKRHTGPMRPAILGMMLLESVVCAALFGFVAATLTAVLLQGPLARATVQFGGLPLGTQLVVSLGAGIYEELVFRVLLVSGLTAIAIWLGWKRPLAVGIAVVVSALVFSAFHYVGTYGDTLTLPSFTFRAIAGMMFSGLYVARGFGITAWTHALYDVGLSLLIQD
jgi:membrane protease YdiL (CAAX protease family)